MERKGEGGRGEGGMERTEGEKDGRIKGEEGGRGRREKKEGGEGGGKR